MSLDARYILSYEPLPYMDPTPMSIDIDYLSKKYGGYFFSVEDTTIYWNKPKHLLCPEEFNILGCDQILERRDGEMWELVK